MKPDRKILRYLSKDPVMRKLIKAYSLPTWHSETPNLFKNLVGEIINQQLSDKASATIFDRFVGLFGGKSFPEPSKILSVSDEKLRSSGISYSKVSYIKNIARAIEDGELDLENIHKLSDEEVIGQLTKIKGIGVWTAEMFLMFSLKRPDVFSFGDLGLRTAISRLYKVDRNDKDKIIKISNKWSPYRTIACRYLWASLDR